jgi:hypothetical protein
MLLTDGEYSPDRHYPNPQWFHIHGAGAESSPSSCPIFARWKASA